MGTHIGADNLKPYQHPDWGRMLKTRNRLVRSAIRELYRDFNGRDGEGTKNGWKAIQRMREEHPDKYILAIMGLAPKNLELNGTIQHAHLHAAITDPEAWLKAVADNKTLEHLEAVPQIGQSNSEKVETRLNSLIKAADSENAEVDDSSDPAGDET